MKKQTDNLANIYDRLRDSDITFLLIHLRLQGRDDLHQGSVPFVARTIAVQCMINVVQGNKDEKTEKKAVSILEKLGFVDESGRETFFMYLDTNKVRSWTGKKIGDLGVLRLPIKTEAECGIKFQHFGNKYVKVNDIVQHDAELILQYGSLWRVVVNKKIAQQAKEYLHEMFPYGV